MSKVRLIYSYLKRLPIIVALKIKYRNRLNINYFQRFGNRFSLKIKGDSKVLIAKNVCSRENLSIIVESGNLSIGKNCFFNNNVSVTCLDKIIIGERCSIANNVVIVDHDHDYNNLTKNPFISSPVLLGNNVWIGANSVILRGSIIGDNCVIAAGSVIKGVVEENTLIYQQRKTDFKKLNRKNCEVGL